LIAASSRAFVEVVEHAAKLLAGDPSDEATEVGPLIRLAEAERVEAWIKEAVAGGAKLVAGGERRGSVITPAILTGTKRDECARRRALWPGWSQSSPTMI